MFFLMGSGGRYPQGAVVELTDVCRLFLNRIRQYLFYVPVMCHLCKKKKKTFRTKNVQLL